jgi:hypothetical protein
MLKVKYSFTIPVGVHNFEINLKKDVDMKKQK